MAVRKTSFLREIKDRVIDAVFPRFCLRCEKEGSLLCDVCFALWDPADSFVEKDLVALFPYADPVARDLIRSWKYHFDQSAWEILKRKMRPRLHMLMQKALVRDIQAIIPLPLHETRLCERGFDQAMLTATFLSEELGIPIVNGLYRLRSTGKQSERSTDERKEEMKRSPFLAMEQIPSSVLLVDDVWTTGATAKAGIEILKRSGAEKVTVFTIAKG